MKRISFLLLAIFFFSPVSANGESNNSSEKKENTLIFYHEIYEYSLSLKKYPEYLRKKQSEEFIPYGEDASYDLSQLRKPKKNSISEGEEFELDPEKMIEFFQEFIEPKVNHPPEGVRIFRDEEGNIQFEGAARVGQVLDREKALLFAQKAYEEGVTRVELPLIEVDPDIIVEDEELREMGIKDLLSVGESDFSGSSWARMYNIEVGASKFNSFLIPQGQVASFNDHLGPVNGSEGYTRELVIMGSELKKEYGGGLCQVSSTAFRAALLAGLPILERYPHSFAVHYYSPWGTDATIYPGSKDMKFENNTKGAILMQTTMHRDSRTLRFHFYGTKDGRQVKMIGTQTAGRATKGFDTTWFRMVFMPEETADTIKQAGDVIISKIFSEYKPSVNWKLEKPKPKEPVVQEAPKPIESTI